MIKELSPETKAKFPEYVEKWVNIGINTEPCDVRATKKAIRQCYKDGGLIPPKAIIGPLNNPYEGAIAEQLLGQLAAEKPTREFKSEADLNRWITKEVAKVIQRKSKILKLTVSGQIYGSQEFWLSSYDFFQNECNLNCYTTIKGLHDLSKVCGWWTPLGGVAIFQHRPCEIHQDEENRSHNLNGPAIKFRGDDSCDVYAVHGVTVPKKVIDRDYSVKDIDAQDNIEIRRVMIDIYGQEKYLMDSNAEIIAEDDFGTLYQKDMGEDEPLMMVKVINSTPEPDGTFKDYFIRVDPTAYNGLTSAMAAVASTWRNKDGSMLFPIPEQYDPEVQT